MIPNNEQRMLESLKLLLGPVVIAGAVIMLLGLFSYYGPIGGTLVLILLLAVLSG